MYKALQSIIFCFPMLLQTLPPLSSSFWIISVFPSTTHLESLSFTLHSSTFTHPSSFPSSARILPGRWCCTINFHLALFYLYSSTLLPILYWEEEVDRFRELPELHHKFLTSLFVIIGFMATNIGEEFSTKHHNVMLVMVFLIVLYFLLLLLGIMLRHRIERLPKILFWIMLVIGSVSSVLVLTIINSLIVWLALPFWVGIFGVISYYNSQELYQLFVSPVSDIINRMIESYREHVARLPR